MNTVLAFLPYVSLVNRLPTLAFILLGLALGLRRLPRSTARVAIWLAGAALFLVWLQIMVWIGRSGLYRSMPRAGLVATVAPALLIFLALTRWRRMGALLDVMPPSWLIAIHFFRSAGFFYLVLWLAGRLTGAFALVAGAGDLIMGLLALPTALYVHWQAPRWRRVAYAYNVLGISDFVFGGLVAFFYGWPTSYPVNLSPTYGAGVLYLLHYLSLWQLTRLPIRISPSQPPPMPVYPHSASTARLRGRAVP